MLGKFSSDRSRGIVFFPLTIGDHVMIEENCVVQAASIGSFVHIGKNCIIVLSIVALLIKQAKRCILKDCCRIEDNTVLAPDTVVAPRSVMSGSPGCDNACLCLPCLLT